MDNITLDLNGCTRCESNGHNHMLFFAFTKPVAYGDGAFYTHFAICPVTNEPILMDQAVTLRADTVMAA